MLQDILDVIVEDDSMWIMTATLNSLFKYDFCREKLELESVYPEKMMCDFEPFSKIVKMGDEIYFIPRMAKGILYYNLSEKEYHELEFPSDGFQEDKNIDVVICGRYIYCVNRFPDMVIKIDSVTKEINRYVADVDVTTNKSAESKIYCSYRNSCFHHGKIIWPNYYNELTMFDIETERFTVDVLADFPQESVGDAWGAELYDWIIGVKSFDDMLWLWTINGKWYLYQDGLQRIDHMLYERPLQCWFWDAAIFKDELYFPPAPQQLNEYMVYNRKTKQFRRILNDWQDNKDTVRIEYNIYKKWGDHKLVIGSYYEKCLYIIDSESNSVYKKKIEFSYGKFAKENAYYDKLYDKLFIKDNLWLADDLDYLLYKVKSSGENEKKDLSAKRNIGKEIFKILGSN